MLKWAVYGKKTQENPITCDFDEDKDTYTQHSFTNKQLRRSLDGPTVKKSKKPSRYQRRSLGSAAVRKCHLKCDDKENINYIGNTPNYFKEGFIKKENLALKDVSNITPTGTPVKGSERKTLIPSKEDKPPDLPTTPPTYSRRVREAKKRKLEMSSSNNNSSSSFSRNSRFCKSERKIKPFNSEKNTTLLHCTSEPSLNDLSDRLSDTIRQSIKVNKQIRPCNISTTKTTSEGLVEIEYDKDLVINCIERPLVEKTCVAKTTVPIFGHNMFMNNPLYFSKTDLPSCMRSLKRTRKKSNEFESSFKSPTIDKKDAHTLLREACSPVAMTPLSMKLADLRFSTMCARDKSERPKFCSEVTEYFPKVEIPFNIPIKDEETSTEMENKFILSKECATNETGSTVSTTQMGDVTLERMIEDIIKSTKIVKNRRRVLNKNNESVKVEAPKLEAKNLFVKPQAENKSDLIKEARYVNLSRENSVSPKTSPTKKMCDTVGRKFNENLLKKLPLGCVILDDGDGYNEREVITPDLDPVKIVPNKLLSRSKSFHSPNIQRTNLIDVPSGSTPDLFSVSKEANLRLKRQKCIRRKKSTLSNESYRPTLIESALTLNVEIPSPATELHNVSIYDSDIIFNVDPKRTSFSSVKSNISSSSIMPQKNLDGNFNSKDLFVMKSENDIPSPITPLANLKRPSAKLSDERANKTSKLDEDIISSDITTPVIEYKSSRRCLTYSPEEASITSSEEKRRSTASNRFERSCERYPVPKGTIDLEISTRNDVVIVHVIRCRDLHRLNGKTEDINSYAKVVISGETETQASQTHRSVFQRTSVLYGKREPEFQRHLKLPLPPVIYEHQHVLVSVWHRDKKYRRSEFLGCVSFPLKDAVSSDISGTFFLQSQVYMRGAPTHDGRYRDSVTDRGNMADSETNNEDVKENHVDKGVTSNGPTANSQSSVAAALQKEADEHLFLRYLELDPPDDPALPRKSQRNGRTPFTTTRKLSRGTAGGFGFTVVWTRPPKVERVATGGSAEKAGLRAGDYIVFVGTKNVVTAGEEEVRNLVKSSGQTLTLETFRRVPYNGVGPRPKIPHAPTLQSEGTPPPQHTPRSPRAAPASPAPVGRPPTACSSTSQSLDRRKLHLPQVTFSKEHLPQTPGPTTDGRKRALLALISREQHYSTCLQFGIVRFVSPLAERADLISPSDHQLLFQNIEEILRLSEEILEQVIQEDGEIQTSTVVDVYLQKTPMFLSLYKKYCLGLKRADCVLVKKSKDPSGAFSRFCTSPPIPRRRPDITSLVHKPLEQFREILRLMKASAAATGAGPYDQLEKKQLQVIVEQLLNAYQDVTAGSGLMGLAGDGKPLLSVADLESRLVFTRCKPFVLSTAGRQWIFGGELSRVEGRTIRPYWALLFSDLLLFATVSRDRVLFVTEEPVALTAVSEAQFNVRKKVTEFRLVLGRAGGESPLVSCSPRTPGRRVTIVLRAPSIDLKAVWQSLLQRQIYRAHTMVGTPLGSPLDSPDPQLTFSLATLDSQQRQTRRSSVETQTQSVADGRSTRSKGSTLHLQRWMTQLPETEEMDPLEPDLETWSIEELRKRSKELNLLDVANLVANNEKTTPPEKKENEKSPSKSSNSGSQITVRTSPVVVDTIPVCRQCHKKCLSKPNSPLVSQKEPILSKKENNNPSPQTSLSNQSSKSDCSTNCEGRKPKQFIFNLERKGAMKLRPEDPHAALKVIDSIEQSQKMLKSTSYELKTDSPILNRSISRSPSTKSQLELRNSIRTPSPSSSSRNNSPLSTSHTTCSSIVFNSSSNDLRMSNSNINNQIQCVVAQEKYLNEVKCVQNITLNKMNTRNNHSGNLYKEEIKKHKTDAFNKVLSMNVIAKRETYGSCMKTSAVFLEDDSTQEDDKEIKFESKMRRSPKMGISAVSKMNGDINKKTENNEDCNVNTKNRNTSDDDVKLMLMGLSTFNPTTHLARVDPFKRSINSNNVSSRPESLNSLKSESPVPNIAVVPPTPDFNPANKTDGVVDDSPDSPDLPEEPPYVTLKRYGTLSSLERFPSDETDDGNVKTQDDDVCKNYSQVNPSGGIMGWTARAGSFVVEKMNIFSYTETAPNTSLLQKQPSFLERCLGVSDWKPVFAGEEGTVDGNEGSGASGEEAWGTPSSGDLSDNLADSEHGTLSSPTKSSSSYAGDDDTELMMDELLMAPTITGPTTLRPLLPRRRLEPLLEEECSDSSSEDNKPTPTNQEQQGSVGGLSADVYCNAPRQPPSACVTGPEGYRAAAAQLKPTQECDCGPELEQNVSPDRTPTNEVPLMLLQSVSKDCVDVRAGVAGAAYAGGRRGSASSASTPSTLDRTTIHNPSTPQHEPAPTASELATVEPHSDPPKKTVTPTEERLSPRTEMRLALDQGKDMLADQEVSWGGGSDPWSFRAACQKSLLRRVSSADAVTFHVAPAPLARPSRPAHRTAPHTTSRNSVYAWKVPESKKPMEMEQLARVEAQTMRSRTPSQCQNGKILGFLRRRASSDSPRREPLLVNSRPFSPRRTTVSNNGYYKICFVNGYV